MDARSGDNDTPTKLGKERINTRLNRRKEAMQKKTIPKINQQTIIKH